MLTYTILCGDSGNVSHVASNSVHFIFTSPPYEALKDYNREDSRNVGNYAKDKYFEMIKPIYKECFRILAPGRRMIVNVPHTFMKSEVSGKSKAYPLPMLTKDLMEEVGFEYENIVAWVKPSGTFVEHVGVVPPSPLLVQRWEECLIFRKPGEPDYSHVTDEQRKTSKLNAKEKGESIQNVWYVNTENTLEGEHPAPYPVELVEYGVRIYTFRGEIVYDPFGGTGTTLLAAKKRGRSGIISELGYKTKSGIPWLDFTKKRVGWMSTTIVGEQTLYRVVKTDGTEIDDLVRGVISNIPKDQPEKILQQVPEVVAEVLGHSETKPEFTNDGVEWGETLTFAKPPEPKKAKSTKDQKSQAKKSKKVEPLKINEAERVSSIVSDGPAWEPPQNYKKQNTLGSEKNGS